MFDGDTHALIPLYMIGVFVSFTLSQAGMVMHWRSAARARAGARARSINGFGAVVTGVVLRHRRRHEGAEGAWIIILLIPLLVAGLRGRRGATTTAWPRS